MAFTAIKSSGGDHPDKVHNITYTATESPLHNPGGRVKNFLLLVY